MITCFFDDRFSTPNMFLLTQAIIYRIYKNQNAIYGGIGDFSKINMHGIARNGWQSSMTLHLLSFQNKPTLRKCTCACVVHKISKKFTSASMSFTNIHHVWPWPPMSSSSGSHLSQRPSPHKRERILWLLDDQLTPRLSRICLGIRFMFMFCMIFRCASISWFQVVSK